jgi:penicillin-binding protein 1C
MRGLSGARASGHLAQELLLSLHHTGRADLLGGDFAAPAGRAPREVCAGGGGGSCAARLTEWLPTDAAAPAPAPSGVRLSIATPEPNTRIWRNPEAPPAANRLLLKATTEPSVPQIVWLVDGAPVAVTSPSTPYAWTLTPGEHRFQIRLPFADATSRVVRVVVE